MWSSKTATSFFLISNYGDLPSRKFSWSPDPSEVKHLLTLWSCQMSNPSGGEAGKPLWRSGWTSNSTDGHGAVDLEPGYLYMHIWHIYNHLTIIKLSSLYVLKVRTHDKPSWYPRIQNSKLSDISKKYLQKSSSRMMLGT